jgi:rare lipoprotein A
MTSAQELTVISCRGGVFALATLILVGSFASGASAGGLAFSGLASYYSYSGGKLANGSRFEAGALTAAHRTLPFGTRVRVTDPKSGRSVIVTINDRGPFGRGRVIDLSLGAARALGMLDRGVVFIQAEIL